MKKKIFVFLSVFLWAFSFAGCKKLPPPPPAVSHGLVIQVEIIRSDGFTRHYTAPEKIDAVLDYLRLLRPLGPIPPTPDALQENAYEIVVYLQDGSCRVHRQQSDCFASKDGGYWGSINPDLGQCLPLLMAQFPSDPKV